MPRPLMHNYAYTHESTELRFTKKLALLFTLYGNYSTNTDLAYRCDSAWNFFCDTQSLGPFSEGTCEAKLLHCRTKVQSFADYGNIAPL